MEFTKVGVVTTVLVLVLGVSMFSLAQDSSDYSGAYVTKFGSKICESTEAKYMENIFVSGKVRTMKNGFWSAWIQEDCNSNFLTEYYCDKDGGVASKKVKCANDCRGRQCNVPVCYDSDAKTINPKLFTGTTKGYMPSDGDFLGIPPAKQQKTYADSCNGDILTEYSCMTLADSTTQQIKSANFDCTTLGQGYTCFDGRCDKH